MGRKKVLKKPEKHVSEPYWDYHEVVNYINNKYNVDLDKYKPKCGYTKEQLEDRSQSQIKDNSDPFLSFWSWITDTQEIHNGCNFYLTMEDEYQEYDEWLKEIFKMLYDEFGEDEMHMYVSW